MAELFKDVPEAIENTVEIARRCSLELKLGKSVLPPYPTPSGESAEDYLRDESWRGLKQRLAQLAARAGAWARDYRSRSTRSAWKSSWASSSRWASPATS